MQMVDSRRGERSGRVSDFVHLHVHSHYSLQNGLARINELVDHAAGLGMGALALTEQENLFSAVKFYQAAQERGIKPIIGAEMYYQDDAAQLPSSLVLLCQNRQGYLHLVKLITEANRERPARGMACIRKDWLQRWNDGLIVLSGAGRGDIGRSLLSGRLDQARRQLDIWRELFPQRYYLELQRTGRADEDRYLERAVRLAVECEVPLVASNDVLFSRPEDFEAHEARVCILSGQMLSDTQRGSDYCSRQYLCSAEEMQTCFSDLPEALENSVEIARRCSLELDLGGCHLPEFQAADGSEQTDYLHRTAETGLRRRLEQMPAGGKDPQVYWDRLRVELKVIIEMDFSGYFLIVADFVDWARSQAIPVGPGRGSGGGSLTAYALKITDLDPIAHDLIFERFLNPERVSMPDFDVDFCMERRDDVIAYVVQRYGPEQVAQIITYGTMSARSVVRDVGRILGHNYGFVDQLAKLIPGDLEMTLEKALREVPVLSERCRQDEEVGRLMELARKLEGTVRHPGRHAGGLVIAPRPLNEYMPLYCEPGSVGTVTQFDMNDIEQIGLVKFDFLGLKTLTVLERAMCSINQDRKRQGAAPLRMEDLALDDTKVYRMIQSGSTAALFQLESAGMKRLIRRLQPERFEDLVDLLALFRPGPLQSGMDESYVEHKRQRQAQYLHASLEPILHSTWGVILYQEQVMQIARSLADYTLGKADLLRRAMGKKNPGEMAKQKYIFVDGAIAKGIKKNTAVRIFEQMEKFAGYGFNKSHSVGYALIAYRTAWLKVHYTAYFMAAMFSSEQDNTERLVGLCRELPALRLRLLPPSVHFSGYEFLSDGAGEIRYGLGAIRGIGYNVVQALLRSRAEQGPFRSLFELCRRIDPRLLNRRTLEILIQSGALDELQAGEDGKPAPAASASAACARRSVLAANLEQAIQAATQFSLERQSGQRNLFAGKPGLPRPAPQHCRTAAPWSEQELLKGEKQTLGQYLSGHPIARYRQELQGILSCELQSLRPGMLWVAGYIERIRPRRSRRGRFAEILIEDGKGRLELIFYAKKYACYRSLLGNNRLIVVRGRAEQEDPGDAFRLYVDECYDLQQLRSHFASLQLCLRSDASERGVVDQLETLLQKHRGGSSPIYIEYCVQGHRLQLHCDDSWQVQISDEFLAELQQSRQVSGVRVQYRVGVQAASKPEPVPAMGREQM